MNLEEFYKNGVGLAERWALWRRENDDYIRNVVKDYGPHIEIYRLNTSYPSIRTYLNEGDEAVAFYNKNREVIEVSLYVKPRARLELTEFDTFLLQRVLIDAELLLKTPLEYLTFR